eukprot:212359-Prymnesium_polylepis.2
MGAHDFLPYALLDSSAQRRVSTEGRMPVMEVICCRRPPSLKRASQYSSSNMSGGKSAPHVQYLCLGASIAASMCARCTRNAWSGKRVCTTGLSAESPRLHHDLTGEWKRRSGRVHIIASKRIACCRSYARTISEQCRRVCSMPISDWSCPMPTRMPFLPASFRKLAELSALC